MNSVWHDISFCICKYAYSQVLSKTCLGPSISDKECSTYDLPQKLSLVKAASPVTGGRNQGQGKFNDGPGILCILYMWVTFLKA